MRYAITYTTDGSFEAADTLIAELETNPLDMPPEELADVLETYGLERQVALSIARDDGSWFPRNVDDVDVDWENYLEDKLEA